MTLLNVCLMTVTEIFGNFNIQRYAKSNKTQDLLLGILGYVGVIYFLTKSFNHGNMLWVGAMWEGMIIVLGSAFAYFYLEERFHHPVQYFGIILGLLAMCCVNYGEQIGKFSSNSSMSR
jgi:multidrug transporter EmrE-like cation transporter